MRMTSLHKTNTFRHIGLLLALLWTSCTKTTNTIPVVTTASSIAAIVKNATNLTLFDSALSKTGLIKTLDSAGPTSPYTLFAPPDAAFAASGITGFTIYGDSVPYLTRLVRYHLIAGETYTAAKIASLLAGPNAPYAAASINPYTGSSDTLYFTVNASGIFVNGSLITQADVTGNNGVIHAISNVLVPPSASIYQTLATDSTLGADSTLTYLVAAIRQASKSTRLDSLLSGTSVFTLFAPTNSAFRLPPFNFTSADTIATIAPDQLAMLLQAHIVAGRKFSSDFYGQLPTLLAGDSIRFSPTYGNVLVQKGDTTFSTVTGFNVMATNGVIHKISQVLLP